MHAIDQLDTTASMQQTPPHQFHNHRINDIDVCYTANLASRLCQSELLARQRS
jgi:hypothetical protein